MSKGQKRSNRELKKPKQTKTKTPAAGLSTFLSPKADALIGGKKK
ncbi:hypothetical protein [Dongia sp.]